MKRNMKVPAIEYIGILLAIPLLMSENAKEINNTNPIYISTAAKS
jgi:hypothetical protein